MPNFFIEFAKSNNKPALIQREVQYNKARFKRMVTGIVNNPSKQFVVDTWNGLTLLLDKTSIIDHSIHNLGNWETPQTARLLSQANCRKDTVFLDIGAHWGLYGMLAHQRGVRDIHLFEPDTRNRNQLCAQLFLNKLDHAFTIWPYAASERDGTVHFRSSEQIEKGNRGAAGILENSSEEAIEIECRALDGLLAYQDRKIVGKIDVEGHEAQVLRGMKNLIAENEMFLQVEVFPDKREEVHAVAEGLGLQFVDRVGVDDYFETK